MESADRIVSLVKDGDRYVFLYRTGDEPLVLKVLGRFAADARLNFSWYDAAVLSQRIRKVVG